MNDYTDRIKFTIHTPSRKAPRTGGTMNPLLTPTQVATYLGVPETTMAQWRYLGKGPSWSKVGRHVRYRQEDVDAWLDTHSHKGQP